MIVVPVLVLVPVLVPLPVARAMVVLMPRQMMPEGHVQTAARSPSGADRVFVSMCMYPGIMQRPK